MNPKFTSVTGYSLEEVLGQNPRVLKSGEMPEEEYRRLWATITSGSVWQGEFHNKTKDGSLFWEAASIAPVVDDHGAITHFVAVKEDVTERKRAEHAFRQESDFNAAILDTARAVIMVLDADGKIVRFNRYCEEISGYSFNEVQGLCVWDLLVPAGEVDAVKNAFEGLLQVSTVDYFENSWKTRSGELRRLAWASTLLPLPNGDGRLSVGIALDITEMRRTEQDLRLKSRLIELTGDAILIRDVEGKITYWNQGPERMYGWTKREAVGRVAHELLRTRFPRPLAEFEEDLIRSGAWEGELVQTTRQGQPIIVNSRWVIEYDERSEPRAQLRSTRTSPSGRTPRRCWPCGPRSWPAPIAISSSSPTSSVTTSRNRSVP